MPAAVLVVEAVVGEADEGFGRAGGVLVAGRVAVADELVGEREVKPGLVGGWVGPEGEVVHAGDEDAVVGGFGEETDAAQAGGGNVKGEVAGEREGDGFARCVAEG